MKDINIGSFSIGKGKTFIIAELSANHGGSLEVAIDTIKAAKEAGADAVKLQTYRADTITIKSNRKEFTINNGSIWDGKTYYDLYESAYTPWDWQPILKEEASKLGLILFSSPFDKSAVDFLENMNVPAYKIASFEITDIPLIEYVASKSKPVIISTGIAEIDDIKKAINACHKMNNHDIILLKCTSSYPAPINEANLNSIKFLKDTFNVEVGLSDHTLDNSVAIAAVALGACVIEKHFILDNSINSADAAFSLNKKQFKEMVKSIRVVEEALGKADLSLTSSQKKAKVFARSLYVVEDIEKGSIFTEYNIKSIRPSNGLHPEYYEKVLGKKALRNIEKGEPLSQDMIEEI